MAHYAEGFATGPGATDAFYQIVRSHLGTNGWSEHDVISNTTGSRNIVFRGAALDATADIRPFVQMQQTNSTTIAWIGHADWDTGTHAGIATAGSTAASTGTFIDTTFPYIIWADAYGMFLCARGANGLWGRIYEGFTIRGLATDEYGITKATTSLSSGATSISVASDMTGILRVGQKILLMNYAHSSASANAANAEAVTISSIASGSIGVSALTKNYDTGAVLGDNVCPLIISSGSTTVATLGGNYYTPYNLDGTRTSVTGQTATASSTTTARTTEQDPTDFEGRYGTGIYTFTQTTSAKLDFKGFPRGGVFVIAGVNAGSPSQEDLMGAQGLYTYRILDSVGSNMTCVGPREL